MAFAQSLLRKMLTDSVPEKHYDVFFRVQTYLRDTTTVTETRLGAHRVVLSAVSPKFEHATACTDDGSRPDEILIRDCTPAAVREALEIIYGGELRESRNSIAVALDVWRFGVLFHVDHLISLARASCLANLSTDNCLRILDFAVRVHDTEIVDNLQNYASENAHFSHVITSPDFERLDFHVISSLVRPGKGECAWPEILTFEKVWFDALVKWLSSRVQPHRPSSPPKITLPPSERHPAESPSGSTAPPPQTSSSSSSSPSLQQQQHQQKEQHHHQHQPQHQRNPSRCHPRSGHSESDVLLVENVLALIDFSRMKTHELRDVSANPIACMSARFPHDLVDVLLTRSEQLESSILERNIDLDVIGQKYQQALCEQDDAERKARTAIDKMEKLQLSKISLEKRFDEIRRKKTANSSGPTSINSARRKMSGSSTII